MIGQNLGSYSIQQELGRGGMGAVYVGVHSLLGRKAAVKVLLPDWSKNQDMVQRFFNEAKAATAIKHPGIVEIYDFGFSPDGSAFIVMEFLEGESLAARLKRLGRLPTAFALGVSRQVATALAVAHKAGIVHRDLKPDNVFLVPDAEISLGERIKLLDFGIAKLAGDGAAGSMQKTSSGMLMGTPYYMSPEQCRGAGSVDARSDLYALGCMLYEMLAGRVPFVAEGAGDIIAAHLLLPPAPLRTLAPEVSHEVEELVMRLLAKTPEQRPQSAEATAHELAALAQAIGMATSLPPVAKPAPVPVVSMPPAVVPPDESPRHMATMAQPVLARPAARAPVAAPTNTLASAAGQEVASPVAARPRRTGFLVGVIIVGLAGAAAGGMLLIRSSSKGGAGQDAGVGGVAGKGKVTAGPKDDIHLIAARTAIEMEMWTEAALEAGAVLKADSSNAEARTIYDQARLEGSAQTAAGAVDEAIAAHDFTTADARFQAIPDDSIYWTRAKRAITAGRESYVLAMTPKVNELIAQNKCKEAKALAAEVATAGGAGPAEPLVKAAGKCKGGSKGGSTAGGSAPLVPTGGPTDEELLEQAKDLQLAGSDAPALKLYDQILSHDPGNQRARFNAAVAAYQLGDCPRALRYLDGLRHPKATKLREKCTGVSP